MSKHITKSEIDQYWLDQDKPETWREYVKNYEQCIKDMKERLAKGGGEKFTETRRGIKTVLSDEDYLREIRIQRVHYKKKLKNEMRNL